MRAYLLSLVWIAQAIFLLECGHRHVAEVTDATDHPTHALTVMMHDVTKVYFSMK